MNDRDGSSAAPQPWFYSKSHHQAACGQQETFVILTETSAGNQQRTLS